MHICIIIMLAAVSNSKDGETPTNRGRTPRRFYRPHPIPPRSGDLTSERRTRNSSIHKTPHFYYGPGAILEQGLLDSSPGSSDSFDNIMVSNYTYYLKSSLISCTRPRMISMTI